MSKSIKNIENNSINYMLKSVSIQLPKSLAPFLWYFLKPYKYFVFLVVLLGGLAGFGSPVNGLLMKYIINSFPTETSDGDISRLTCSLWLIIFNFIILDNFTSRGIGYLYCKFLPIIKNRVLSETRDFVLRNSHKFSQNNLSDRLSAQIRVLADNIELILHIIAIHFIRAASLLIGCFVIVYYVSHISFYILLVWVITFLPLSLVFSKPLIKLAHNQANSESVLAGQLTDRITNNSNMLIFARRSHEIPRMGQFFSATKQAFQKKGFFLLILNSVQELMIAIMMILHISLLSFMLYTKSLITIEDFALIFSLAITLAYKMWYNTISQVDEFNQAIGKSRQCLSALINDLSS
jgi:ATP-binding cassette subfamily B protein